MKLDWMLHRIDALLHVGDVFKVVFPPERTGFRLADLPRWVDVLKFLISTYRCDFRQCLSLRVQFVVSALQSSSAGFRLGRIYLTDVFGSLSVLPMFQHVQHVAWPQKRYRNINSHQDNQVLEPDPSIEYLSICYPLECLCAAMSIKSRIE